MQDTNSVMEKRALAHRIEDLRLLLSVAQSIPVGEENPIDWDKTVTELDQLEKLLKA